jgi:hypothetical protein
MSESHSYYWITYLVHIHNKEHSKIHGALNCMLPKSEFPSQRRLCHAVERGFTERNLKTKSVTITSFLRMTRHEMEQFHDTKTFTLTEV